jgi:hypothetical protein
MNRLCIYVKSLPDRESSAGALAIGGVDAQAPTGFMRFKIAA